MRHCAVELLAIAMLVGCTARPTPLADTPSVAPHAAAPVSRDDGLVTLSGRVLAHDGSPLHKAEVSFQRRSFDELPTRQELGADGRFELELAPGTYMIVLGAVDHAAIRHMTIVSGDLRVDGTLGTYARKDPGESLRLRAEWLDHAGKVIGHGPAEARRVEPQVYRIELRDRPEAAARLRYQLAAGSVTYNGPSAQGYESDQGGDYWSLVELGERTAIDLDLRTLPPAGQAPKLAWHGEDETTRSLLAFLDSGSAKLGAWRSGIALVDGKIMMPTDADRAKLGAIAGEAGAAVEATKDARTATLLRLAHICLFAQLVNKPDDLAALREHLAWIVEHVPADEPRLALLPNLDGIVFRALEGADTDLVARGEAWLDSRLRDNADPGVAGNALELLITRADRRRDDARVRELYTQVLEERFSGTYARRSIVERFDPERTLQRGKTLPGFDFAMLEGDGSVTSTDREGRLYLLEFWATWCGPCVAEMPKLHQVYATINGAQPLKRTKDGSLRKLGPAKRPRVEFVFVSLDADRTAVADFRRDRWSMPWTHAFVGNGGPDKQVMKQFGFSGVPTAILVDEHGTILDVGEPLRGDALQPTLERALAERR